MIRTVPDRLFGGAIAVLSILFLVFAVPTIDAEEGTQFFSVGPRLFPNITGALTLLLGALIALQGRAQDRIEPLQAPENRRSLLLVLAIALAFIILLTILGFLISAFLALTTFMLVFGERRIQIVLPVALGIPLFVYLIFLNAFALELPAGPLDFLLGGQ